VVTSFRIKTESRAPLSPGRAERQGFEYFRHDTRSLYAAFNTKTGEVLGKTAARHTSTEFAAFLTDIVIDQPSGKEIHVIADNLAAHKSKPVTDFLAAHPCMNILNSLSKNSGAKILWPRPPTKSSTALWMKNQKSA